MMFVSCDLPSCGKQGEPSMSQSGGSLFHPDGQKIPAYPNGWIELAVWGGKTVAHLCSPSCVIDFCIELMKPENSQYLKPKPAPEERDLSPTERLMRKLKEGSLS